MPSLQQDLNTTYFLVGISLQMNWLVKGVSTLFWGNLSDIYGRKISILFSFVFYIVGTLGCYYAKNISGFLLARMVQGIGEGSAAVSSAIARDVLVDPQEVCPTSCVSKAHHTSHVSKYC
jgi:MFS transporter, DHA1 family, multidrug resistance protein